MLLNWNTIDACFLSSSLHIRSSLAFFGTCLGSALLVISLEFIRRYQRKFDRYLRSRNAHLQERDYAAGEEMEKLLDKHGGENLSKGLLQSRTIVVVLEQCVRGLIHMVQFAVSYCIMLLFMYSNGMDPFYA